MPVSTTAELPYSVDRVWALVSDFAGLRRWHPLLVDCRVEGEGIGARQRAVFASWSATEQLDTLSISEHELTYRIVDATRPEIVGAMATMKVEAVDGGSRLTWVSGLPDEHPAAEQVHAELAAYYPVRLDHLRASLAGSR